MQGKDSDRSNSIDSAQSDITRGDSDRIVEAFPPIIPIFPAHLTVAMATSDVEMHGSDSDSVMSEPLGPNTLQARIMVPDTRGNAPDALDSLAIPAIATNCERTFSSGRKLISPERNRPSDDIIEATECLKAWWDSGIIKQLRRQ
jgi:hypothetical protein